MDLSTCAVRNPLDAQGIPPAWSPALDEDAAGARRADPVDPAAAGPADAATDTGDERTRDAKSRPRMHARSVVATPTRLRDEEKLVINTFFPRQIEISSS